MTNESTQYLGKLKLIPQQDWWYDQMEKRKHRIDRNILITISWCYVRNEDSSMDQSMKSGLIIDTKLRKYIFRSVSAYRKQGVDPYQGFTNSPINCIVLKNRHKKKLFSVFLWNN